MRAFSVLRQPPIHQKRNDLDDNRGHENVSASTLVTIDTATRTALHDWVQASSTHGRCPEITQRGAKAMAHCRGTIQGQRGMASRLGSKCMSRQYRGKAL